MFKSKHVYTCPDVIHDRQVALRNAKLIYALYGATFIGAWIYGSYQDKRREQPAEDNFTLNVPTSTVE